MIEKLSIHTPSAPLDPEAVLLIQRLDQWLQVSLMTLPDRSFTTSSFIPAPEGGFISVYSKTFLYKGNKLFETCDVMMADVDVKKLVFKARIAGMPIVTLLQFLNNLADWLGKDLHQKKQLANDEVKDLQKGEWAGRKWLVWFDEERRLPLMVDASEGQLQLCLYLPV